MGPCTAVGSHVNQQLQQLIAAIPGSMRIPVFIELPRRLHAPLFVYCFFQGEWRRCDGAVLIARKTDSLLSRLASVVRRKIWRFLLETTVPIKLLLNDVPSPI